MEHNAKILLADDSHAIRFLVSEILTNAGFTVIEAEDGQEAIDKTYKENPDLLILDYEMPHKTGFDVVRRSAAAPAIYTRRLLFLPRCRTSPPNWKDWAWILTII